MPQFTARTGGRRVTDKEFPQLIIGVNYPHYETFYGGEGQADPLMVKDSGDSIGY